MNEQAEMEVLDKESGTKSAVSVFDPIESVLDLLREEAKTTVYDLTTTGGDKAAREFRARCVSAGTAAEEAYTTWNQPILEEQRKAREKRDYIKIEVSKIKDPVDKLIKERETAKAAEKAERERIAEEQRQFVAARIDRIKGYAVRAATLGSEAIEALCDELHAIEPTLEDFGQRAGEAMKAKHDILDTLESLYAAAVDREDAARALAEAQAAIEAERERLAEEERQAAVRRATEEAEREATLQRQREELAEQQRRIEAAATERERQTKAERDAEEARQQQEAAARQADLDLQQAELNRQRLAIEAAQAEAARKEQERIDAELRAEREKQEEAERIAQAERDRIAAAEKAELDRKAAEAAEIKAEEERREREQFAVHGPGDAVIVAVLTAHFRAESAAVIAWLKKFNPTSFVSGDVA